MIDDPFAYDRDLQVQLNTPTVAGDITDSWADQETNVRAQLIFSGAQDKEEAGQPLNVERRRYKIMESGRAYDPDLTRFRETGTTEWFYMTRITPWKGSKWVSVIEGINRSDD